MLSDSDPFRVIQIPESSHFMIPKQLREIALCPPVELTLYRLKSCSAGALKSVEIPSLLCHIFLFKGILDSFPCRQILQARKPRRILFVMELYRHLGAISGLIADESPIWQLVFWYACFSGLGRFSRWGRIGFTSSNS